MRIKAIVDFFTPGQKGCEAGKEYDVTEAFGSTLVKRELAEVMVIERKKSESKQTTKK